MANDKGHILSVNAGSSSLKISLFSLTRNDNSANSSTEQEPIKLLVTSSISNISSPPAKFSFEDASDPDKSNKEDVDSITDHASAFAHFLDSLKEKAKIDGDQIAHVCHRVVHGGDYADPVIISKESYHHIERLTDLAPL